MHTVAVGDTLLSADTVEPSAPGSSGPGGTSPAATVPPTAHPSTNDHLSLRVEDLTLVRRGLCLLDSCTFEVRPGEILSVMGPSGAGKSTLLKTLAGLCPPDAGHVTRPPGRAAMVYQDPRLLPWRTTRANVEIVLPREQRSTAVTWLERVGLGDALDVYPAALSGGMRQRVAIARALACDAAVVLVDEPFSSLDAETSLHLRELLTRELRTLRRPVVWVTHDPAEAAAVATSSLTMDGPPSGAWHLDGRHTDPLPPTST